MSITTRHISDFIEKWAPNATKLEYDNTGLLSGNLNKHISKVLTCLDVTDAVIDEAISENVDLIVSHHPLIFPKIQRITESDPTGRLLRKLIRSDIDLIAAHTNLDAARNGVSFELAKQLGLNHIHFLDQQYKSLKVVVLRFPARLRDDVQLLLSTYNFDTGWSTEENNIQVARFNYDGYRLPALQDRIHDLVDGAPYSIDIFPSENPSLEFGFGAIGDLDSPMNADSFIEMVSEKLESRALRFSGNPSALTIRTVAVCGGSGVSLAKTAWKQGADAFITADIKYHEFFIPKGKLLIDAGHYETEVCIVRHLANEISQAFPELVVIPTSVNTNPVYGLVHTESSKTSTL